MITNKRETWKIVIITIVIVRQENDLLTVSCVLSGAIAVISTGLGSGGFALLRMAAGIFATRDNLLVSCLPNSARRRTLTRGPVPLYPPNSILTDRGFPLPYPLAAMAAKRSRVTQYEFTTRRKYIGTPVDRTSRIRSMERRLVQSRFCRSTRTRTY